MSKVTTKTNAKMEVFKKSVKTDLIMDLIEKVENELKFQLLEYRPEVDENGEPVFDEAGNKKWGYLDIDITTMDENARERHIAKLEVYEALMQELADMV